MGTVHLSFEELSALFDGELSAQADTSARQHLRECPQCSAEYSLSVRLERDLRQPPVLSCEACRGEVQLWGTVGYVLRTLPVGRPSARVDQAIARLANPPRRIRIPAFPVLAPRLAIAAAAIVAV